MTESAVIIETGTQPVDSCVIWLHGLGADGHDFEPIVHELNLPDSLSTRFIFPHAPMMPVTINNGYVMRAWYDIKAMNIGSEQDEAGIRQSQVFVEQLITQQMEELGLSSDRIVLAGFSQGGAVILQTGLRLNKPLAGLMALSTYLPLADSFAQEKSPENAHVALFFGHGDRDPVIPPQLAHLSRSRLEQQGYQIEWHEYMGMQHSVCIEEITHISQWLQKILAS